MSGHPPSAVWEYTPRQIWAFLSIARRRRRRDLADLLNIQLLATSGDGAAITRQLRAFDG